MRSQATALLLSAALFAMLGQASAAGAPDRLRGIVREVVITHCDLASRSCAGSLELEIRDAAGKALAFEVPLGTPISQGCRSLRLHELEGRAVVLTQSVRPGERIARAIEIDTAEGHEGDAEC